MIGKIVLAEVLFFACRSEGLFFSKMESGFLAKMVFFFINHFEIDLVVLMKFWYIQYNQFLMCQIIVCLPVFEIKEVIRYFAYMHTSHHLLVTSANDFCCVSCFANQNVHDYFHLSTWHTTVNSLQSNISYF